VYRDLNLFLAFYFC